MSSIFISHSVTDNVAVKGLMDRLKSWNHHSVFLDFDPDAGIQAGRSWERTLYRKLRACQAVVAWVTDAYLESHWCFAEIALARMEGKHIFAILDSSLSADATLPSILTEKQFMDLRQGEEQGYLRLKNGLKELDILGTSRDWDPKEAPYRGLNYYDEKHAPLFFGREDETRAGMELINRGAPNLIMILGGSGSGKSSLTRAGILPRLRQDPDQYLIVEPLRPRRNPFRELTDVLDRAFRRIASTNTEQSFESDEIRELLDSWRSKEEAPADSAPPDATDQTESKTSEAQSEERIHALLEKIKELKEELPRSPETRSLTFLDWTVEDLRRITNRNTLYSGFGPHTPLHELANRLISESGQRHARVVIVVDQFEELLGFEEKGPGHPANRFLDLLRNTLDSEHCPILVIGTMRSDFLSTFQRNPALRGVDFESLSLGPMKVEGMRKVIEAPAKLGAIELEKGLADLLLADTETPDALPLLSFTLWVLWRDYADDGLLEVKEYKEELGGLDGAMAREADALLRSAEKEGKVKELRRALVSMARLSEEEKYARRMTNWDAEELQPVHRILDDFVDRFLLVKYVEGGEIIVEVAHEALFRSWAPLKSWLDENRADLLLKQQIERSARAWESEGKSNDRLWRGGPLQQAGDLKKREGLPKVEAQFVEAGLRRRRFRRVTLVSLTTSVILTLSGFLLFALDRKRQAEEEKLKAFIQAGKAQLIRAENHKLESDAPFYAARAIGFEGVGKSTPTGLSSPSERTPPSTPDVRLNFSNQQPDPAGQKPALSESGKDPEFPRLLTKSYSLNDSNDAYSRIDTAAALPFLWSSPDGSHHSAPVTQVLIDRKGRFIFSASQDKTVKKWDVKTGKLLQVLEGHTKSVWSISLSPDEKTLASGSSDNTIKIWDLETGKQIVSLQEHSDRVLELDFSKDGNYLASGSHDHTIKLWDLTDYSVKLNLQGHTDFVRSVDFSADGDQICSGSLDGTIILWDTETGDKIRQLEGHTESVWAVRFSPDGKSIASGSQDGSIILWDIATGNPSRTFDTGSWIKTIAFSPDGKTVASGSYDNLIRLWSVESGEERRSIPGHSAGILSITFSRDGKTIVSGSEDHTIKIWNTESGEPQYQTRGHTNWVWCVDYSPDGRLIASGSSDNTAKIWDLKSGEQLFSFDEHNGKVTCIAFSPDGSLLASGSEDKTIMIWDPTSGRVLHTLKGHTDRVKSLDFSPDGNTLATGGSDNKIVLWNVKTGQKGKTLSGHTDRIWSVAFSPDGNTLASGSSDSKVILWDVPTGKAKGEPIEASKEDSINTVAFSPDGKLLATGSYDESIKLWDAKTGEFKKTLATLEKKHFERPIQPGRKNPGKRGVGSNSPSLAGQRRQGKGQDESLGESLVYRLQP